MDNYRSVRFVLYYTMVLNLVVTVAKLGVGYATGSLSLVADGLDSFFDSASNVIGLVGIHIAARPPDVSHPYGHRKFETLSAVTISILLFVTTIELVQSAIQRFRNPVVPVVNLWTLFALTLSIGMHLYVSVYERRRGRELKSDFLVADAAHTRADVLVSVSVLAGMIVVRLGFPIIDAILALVIAVLIAKIGVDIIRASSKILLDAVAIDEVRVRRIVGEVPGVLTFHNIRSRGQEDDVHLDLHVRVQQGTPVEQAHHIAHQVQRKLLAGIPGVRDVVVHVEPEEGPENGTQHNLDQRIREIASRLPGAAVHAIRVHELHRKLYVTLHLEVEPSLSVERAHSLASQLEDMLRVEIPQTEDVEVHTEPTEPQEAAAEVDAPTAQSVMQVLAQATDQVRELCDCHDVAISRVNGHLNVSAHWSCDPALTVEQAHALTHDLEQRVQERMPEVGQLVVHVEPRAADGRVQQGAS